MAFHLIESRCYQQQLGFERKGNKGSLFPQSRKGMKKTKPKQPKQTNKNWQIEILCLSPMGFHSRLFLVSHSPCALSYSTVTSLKDIPQSLLTAWPKSGEGTVSLMKSMASDITCNSSSNNHQAGLHSGP